nr:hypothetical protein [Tanacetum cinerariifolium]
MAQNIDFSDSNQIQTPQYPEFHPPSQEISDKVFQANHSVQYKENLENSSNSNQEKEGPPQDSNIRHLIREEYSNQEKEEPPQDSDMHQLIKECCTEICEEQKQSMEDTMLELEVKNVVEQPAERENCNIQSLQNFRVVHKSSISFRNTSQISSIHAIAPILSTKEPEHSLRMGYKHLSITPETEFDEVTESNAENLLPIPSECEVALEDKRNVEYVEASLPDPKIVSVEEENVVQQEEEEIEPDQERLINLVENDILDDSTNDPLLGEADLFLAADHSIAPGIENFMTRKGTSDFLKLYLSMIPFFLMSHLILILRIIR